MNKGEFAKRIEKLRKYHFGPKDFVGKQSIAIVLSNVLDFVADARSSCPLLPIHSDQIKALKEIKEEVGLNSSAEAILWFVEWFGAR